MKYLSVLILILLIFPLRCLDAHGYVFSKSNNEIRDNVKIDLYRGYLTIFYQSVYQGQIAPHIRNMIDADADTVLTKDEIDHFIAEYRQIVNDSLKRLPFYVGKNKVTLKLVDVFAPNLEKDSLLAPLKLEMLFSANNLPVIDGENEIQIDPKLFFENSSQFVWLAKKRVNFTEQQDKVTGRYLQIKMFASDGIKFLSTFPGRIRKKNNEISIYGVFYDATLLKVEQSKVPKFRIKFTGR